jgi:hypothetical protein
MCEAPITPDEIVRTSILQAQRAQADPKGYYDKIIVLEGPWREPGPGDPYFRVIIYVDIDLPKGMTTITYIDDYPGGFPIERAEVDLPLSGLRDWITEKMNQGYRLSASTLDHFLTLRASCPRQIALRQIYQDFQEKVRPALMLAQRNNVLVLPLMNLVFTMARFVGLEEEVWPGRKLVYQPAEQLQWIREFLVQVDQRVRAV